ncbi:hypothetical protein BC629DRAFT_1486933 [Irpex lacteus]|nr:hypothetical protein BC629DRAFT_1486933 [Irpex lacteus]
MTLEDVYHTLQQQDMIHIRETAASPRPLPGQSFRFIKGRKSGIARKALHRNNTRDDDSVKGPFVPPTSYEISWDREAVARYLVARTLKTDGLLEDALPSATDSFTPTTPGLETRSSVAGGSRTSRTESPYALFDDDADDDDDDKHSVSDALPVVRPSRGKQRRKSSVIPQSSPISDDTPRRLTRRRTSSALEAVTPKQQPASMRRTRSAVKLPSFQHDEAMIAEDAAFAAKLAMEDRPRRMLRSRSNTNPVPDKRALSPHASSRSVSPKKRRRVDPDTPPARNTRSQGPLPKLRRPPAVKRRSSMRSQASTVGSARKPRPGRRPSRVVPASHETSPLSRPSPPPDTPSSASMSHVAGEENEEEGGDEEDAMIAQLETTEAELRPEPERDRDRNNDTQPKDEERDTPLTGLTSRHSVGQSDDTVCVTDDQGGTVKVSPPLAVAVANVPVSADNLGGDGLKVKAGLNGAAAVSIPGTGGDNSDVDAEGEEDPDAEGEPYVEDDLDADAEGEEDLDAEGEPDLDDVEGEGEAVGMEEIVVAV